MGSFTDLVISILFWKQKQEVICMVFKHEVNWYFC